MPVLRVKKALFTNCPPLEYRRVRNVSERSDNPSESSVQVKKAGMREAILEAAFDLFSRKGYTNTTMSEISRAAGMTVANLYVYFDSKLAILYAIYRPWTETNLNALRRSVLKFRTPRTRLKRIFIGIWRDIPGADHSFANTLMEALASAPEQMGKPNNLLEHVETFVTDLMLECLPEDRHHVVRNSDMSHIIWMAHDGFVINMRLGDLRDIDRISDLMADLILGESSAEK